MTSTDNFLYGKFFICPTEATHLNIYSLNDSFKYFSIFSIDLIPPPTSTDIPSFLIMLSIISKLINSPVSAPSRSTMCKFNKPNSLYLDA